MAGEGFILPSWKRKPHSFHTLPTGEVIVLGPGRKVHSMRTQYIRYTAGIVGYLQQIVKAQRVIRAEEAETILRTVKPNTAYSKRDPVQAEPDIVNPEWWKDRPARLLSAEQLAIEQLANSPKQLERELRRIRESK